MSGKLAHDDKHFLRIVGEVLHYVWDPIGVRGVPEARDEYEGYAGRVFALLRAGASESEISTHLQHVAAEQMGLDGSKERSDAAASVLTDWRDHLSGSRVAPVK